jgi:Mg2+ and Co2+ transporter CorA
MNRGQVVLDVIAKGTDEVSAMLRKVGEQAKSTEKQLDSMADSTADIGRQSGTDKLSAGFDKIDGAVNTAAQGVEKFNKVMGIAGFIGGLAAAGTAVIAFARELLKIDDSAKIVINSTKAINEALKSNIETFRKWRIEQAASEEQRTQLEIQNELADIAAERIKLTGERVRLESQLPKLIEQQRDLEQQLADSKKTSVDSALGLLTNEQGLLEALVKRGDGQRAINEAQAALVRLKASEGDYTDRVNFLLGKQRENMDTVISRAAEGLSVVRAFAEAMGIQVKPREPVKPIVPIVPTVPPGGNGGRRTSQLEELMRLGEEKTRQRLDDEEAMRRHEEAMAKAEKAAEEARIKASEARIKAEEEMALMREIDAFGPLADDVANATAAMLSFGDAVGAAAGAFPDLSDALSETMGIWSAYGDRVDEIQKMVANGTKTSAEATVMAEDEKTKALIAGTTAGLAAVAKSIGGLRAEYAVRAAGELAAGFATLANPVESAGHFAAAGLYAIAAGTSPPSGGGSARGAGAAGTETDMGGGSTSASTVDREPRTIVYNFSTLIADRQQVGRAIRDSELASERNGYGRRRGV